MIQKIKLFKIYALLPLFLLFYTASWALNLNKGNETVKIKSSIQCGMCENTLRSALKDVKGVKKVNFVFSSQEIVVKYNPKQANIDQIRQAISKAGYDADGVAADTKAYEKLPACCKKPKS